MVLSFLTEFVADRILYEITVDRRLQGRVSQLTIEVTSSMIYSVKRVSHTGCVQIASVKYNSSSVLLPTSLSHFLGATVVSKAEQKAMNRILHFFSRSFYYKYDIVLL